MIIKELVFRLGEPFVSKLNIWKLKSYATGNEFMKFVYYRKLSRMGSYIGADATFSSVPTFPHGITGIFIPGGVQIGNNVTIYQHVTIAANYIEGSKNYGCPKIGDNVFIGANAVIVGAVTIGNNVRIGAGATVAIDIPDNAVVVPQKPRVIIKEDCCKE